MTESLTQPITENLWWVIPGKLAGVRKPLATELSDLKAIDIGAIVSVMDDPSNLEVYEQASLPYRWLPTQGGTAPSLEQVQLLQQFVDEQVALGHGVAVHCTSGKRRTGTLLAAYLIQNGSSFDDAIQTILIANPAVELREAQIQFLKSLADEHDTL
jgi:protein-tyrosine phosphatase